MSYLPTFTTTAEMVSLVSEITELVCRFDSDSPLVPSPRVRRANLIRSVHSSTRIEGNSLTLGEATAVIEGKRVVAPAAQIREVRQAFAAYEALDQFDPLSLDDLLRAHGIMMDGLAQDAGHLRQVEVGVYAGFRLIHAGAPSAELPQAMAELFEWLRTSKDHPLIQGCFFHCAFERIHPFADGNGRTGRLWHSLINRRWKAPLAWAPVETMLSENQQEYYAVLGFSDSGDATLFIEFMLEMIRDALAELVENASTHVGENHPHVGKNVGENHPHLGENVGENHPHLGDDTPNAILALLRESPRLSASALAAHVGLSKRQVERILARLKKEGRLERVGPAKGGHWKVQDPEPTAHAR